MNIRAEVSYVNAEEAKKLIAVEGYTVLDVRDKSQFDRAHIKSCYHVPLFVENKDSDFGNYNLTLFSFTFSGTEIKDFESLLLNSVLCLLLNFFKAQL